MKKITNHCNFFFKLTKKSCSESEIKNAIIPNIPKKQSYFFYKIPKKFKVFSMFSNWFPFIESFVKWINGGCIEKQSIVFMLNKEFLIQ